MDMEVLTIGLKMINDQGKVFIMRYICSKNWTIPSLIINDENARNDITHLKNVFTLVPGGINVMSLNKIVYSEAKESIRSEDGDEKNTMTIQHKMTIFEALVEVTGEQSLLDIPLKFDYAQWVPLESLINVPFTNRITKVLVEYETKAAPLPMVLSGIM